MRRIVLGILVIVFFTSISFGAEDWKKRLPTQEKVPEYLQDISVMVSYGGVSGSGVIKTRELDGKKMNFIWTAYHVIESARKVESVNEPNTGKNTQRVKYNDVRIIKQVYEGSRPVGQISIDAVVLRCSKSEDLALLKLRKFAFIDASAVFYLDNDPPKISTKVFHVGSFLGENGINSLSTGIISQNGRIVNGKEYDQVSSTSFPGSSGGGIYLENGALVGFITMGAGETFSLMVPVRRVIDWAKRNDVYWAVDDSAPMPDLKKLSEMKVEDPTDNFGSENSLLPTNRTLHNQILNSTDLGTILTNINIH